MPPPVHTRARRPPATRRSRRGSAVAQRARQDDRPDRVTDATITISTTRAGSCPTRRARRSRQRPASRAAARRAAACSSRSSSPVTVVIAAPTSGTAATSSPVSELVSAAPPSQAAARDGDLDDGEREQRSPVRPVPQLAAARRRSGAGSAPRARCARKRGGRRQLRTATRIMRYGIPQITHIVPNRSQPRRDTPGVYQRICVTWIDLGRRRSRPGLRRGRARARRTRRRSQRLRAGRQRRPKCGQSGRARGLAQRSVQGSSTRR